MLRVKLSTAKAFPAPEEISALNCRQNLKCERVKTTEIQSFRTFFKALLINGKEKHDDNPT